MDKSMSNIKLFPIKLNIFKNNGIFKVKS
jgi:hypothetical protein